MAISADVNALAESFDGLYKTELLDRKRWKTRLDFIHAIIDDIEVFCNRQRRHSSLDYVSPVEFEMSLTEQTA